MIHILWYTGGEVSSLFFFFCWFTALTMDLFGWWGARASPKLPDYSITPGPRVVKPRRSAVESEDVEIATASCTEQSALSPRSLALCVSLLRVAICGNIANDEHSARVIGARARTRSLPLSLLFTICNGFFLLFFILMVCKNEEEVTSTIWKLLYIFQKSIGIGIFESCRT